MQQRQHIAPLCPIAQRNSATAQQRNSATAHSFFYHARYICTLMLALFWHCTTTAQFVPSLSGQNVYPLTGTAGLNLDQSLTKYLSNFSFPGSGSLMNNTIQIAGWSTDNDGGFSYSREMSIPPYTFTGDGAIAIPNARDVQVGILNFTGNYYLIAAYYDVVAEMYAYDLYDYTFMPPSTVTVNKLYTYYFRSNDNVLAPPYTPTTDYTPSYSSIPDYRMGYNRISMDIDKDGQKVAIVMSNGNNSRMYLAVGQSGMDTIIFSPNLPNSPTGPIATGGGGPEYAVPTILFGGGGWVANGGDWDYTDMSTGVPIYVRYLASTTGNYLYSYYPIDDNVMIRIVDGTGLVIGSLGTTAPPYCPLLGVKAKSLVTTPGINPYFNQIWPDICFNDNNLTMVCYINNPMTGVHPITLQENGAEDLYVSAQWAFSDYYTYTGVSPYGAMPTYVYEGPNHLDVSFFNTFDGKPLRASPTTTMPSTTWSTYDFESLCKSLPLVPGEDIRAKIDGSDAHSHDYAITFAYSGVPTGGYSAVYPDSKWVGAGPCPGTCTSPHPTVLIVPVHSGAEFGKRNIYVRYGINNSQAILTNNSIAGGHAAINSQQNFSPCVSFKPMSANRFSVAWVSEQAGGGGNPFSYIGVEIDKSVAYGFAGYRVSPASYLRVPNNPSLSNLSGAYPVVSLSKHQFGLSRLYTCFAQEDMTPLYSMVHKNHDWAVSATWRTSEESNIIEKELSVGPNPFSNSLHISSSQENVTAILTDVLGKQLLAAKGSSEELNKQLDNVATSLPSGAYLLNVAEGNKSYKTFKLTKQ